MVSSMSPNPYDELLQVVRIETTRPDGKHRYGTGFPHLFASKKIDEKSTWATAALVTNSHVINDAKDGYFLMNRKDSNGQCRFGDTVKVRFERKEWIQHTDEKIDLSVLPLSPIFKEMNIDLQKEMFLKFYNTSLPDPDIWEMFSPMEDIVTLGFPNGFWDHYNNAPVVRKGVTATHPKLNYNNEEAFWIDVTIYPGMSGSPVFIAGYGLEFYKTGGYSTGAKTYFLGILSAMAKYKQDRSGIEMSYIPTTDESSDKDILNVISSLGYVIKATKLKEFDSILEKI